MCKKTFKRTIRIKFSNEEVSTLMKLLKRKLYKDSNIDKEKKIINYINSIEDKEKDRLYNKRYTHYILKEFNSAIVNMMISYINKDNSFPEKYKKEPNFIHNIINLLKHLFMNEIEIACFTILIEKMGWRNKKIEQWLYFEILGIITKKLCGNDNDLYILVNFISKNNPKFIGEYTAFIDDNKIKNKLNKYDINIKYINKRFIFLRKPINTYCKNNFINIEGLLDEIIRTSQSYCKNKSNNEQIKINIKKVKEKINKIQKIENNVINDSLNKKEECENFFENINNINQINFTNIKNLGYNLSDKLDFNLDKNNNIYNWTLSNLDNLNSFK